jgi:hypothetical protein
LASAFMWSSLLPVEREVHRHVLHSSVRDTAQQTLARPSTDDLCTNCQTSAVGFAPLTADGSVES